MGESHDEGVLRYRGSARFGQKRFFAWRGSLTPKSWEIHIAGR